MRRRRRGSGPAVSRRRELAVCSSRALHGCPEKSALVAVGLVRIIHVPRRQKVKKENRQDFSSPLKTVSGWQSSMATVDKCLNKTEQPLDVTLDCNQVPTRHPHPFSGSRQCNAILGQPAVQCNSRAARSAMQVQCTDAV